MLVGARRGNEGAISQAPRETQCKQLIVTDDLCSHVVGEGPTVAVVGRFQKMLMWVEVFNISDRLY